MPDQTASKLLDLLRERAAAEHKKDYDAATIRDEWINAVHALIDQIEGWLRAAEDQGLATLHREQIQLSEEVLGTYTSEQLWAELPGQQVLIVRPIGRIIIGGAGRVDLIVGPRNAMLVRDQNCAWALARRAPRLKMIPLTAELFDDVVSDLLRGE